MAFDIIVFSEPWPKASTRRLTDNQDPLPPAYQLFGWIGSYGFMYRMTHTQKGQVGKGEIPTYYCYLEWNPDSVCMASRIRLRQEETIA